MKYWSPNRHLERDGGVLAGEGDGVAPARAFLGTPALSKGASLNPLCLNKIVPWNPQLFHF